MSPDFDDVLVEVLATNAVCVGVFDVSPPITNLWRARIESKLAARDATASTRLHLLRPVSHSDLVAGIARAAMVLDTPHFSGGSTSLDAIAAATPIATFQGNRLRANQTAAMLKIVGAPELIANNSGEYVDIVSRILVDDAESHRLSDALRMGASRLFDDSAPVVALQRFFEHAVSAFPDPPQTDFQV